MIKWETNKTKNDVAHVKLFYTVDGGSTWKPICDPYGGKCTLIGDPREYEWTVPALNKRKSKCKVKAVLKDVGGKTVGSDDSDGYFVIEVD